MAGSTINIDFQNARRRNQPEAMMVYRLQQLRKHAKKENHEKRKVDHALGISLRMKTAQSWWVRYRGLACIEVILDRYRRNFIG